MLIIFFFFFSSRRRHTRLTCDWSSDVCSSDLGFVQRHGGGAPNPRYADVELVRSVDELLARTVDLVVIATPNTSHHPIAKQCLQAGRHVVIDKPFTTTVAE